MNDHLHILFAPLLPIYVLGVMAGAALALSVYALLHHTRGAWMRAALFALLLLALANPSIIAEQREALKDVALIAIDDSASMRLGDRSAQVDAAVQGLTKKLSAFSDLDVETVHIQGMERSDLFQAMEQKLASLPRDRLAGVIALTDGEVHDKPMAPFTAPLQALIAGHRHEVDRRLTVTQAPAYGIVGKKVTLTLRIDDEPAPQSANASVTVQHEGRDSETLTLPIGKDVTFDAPVDHAGQNLFVFSTPALPHELTAINNATSVTVNGIRDRLRVLLVSGQPHIGGRTWRNFLKSDPAVDLVHFTILRSPNKQDNTPNTELSLIAFPVRELFETKLKSFDLVIFDRFRNQSLVPDEYLGNIAAYVESGGALLVSSATDDGMPPLTLSSLARVLPTEPSGKLLTGSFVPEITEMGWRHPVTATLDADMPHATWGPWFRQIDAHARSGEVVMTGLNHQPLLVLDHVGQGRVAQFLSDQFWLWSRGYAGGGPQAELLRRVAHWLVQEPALDETALRAVAKPTESGFDLILSQQSLQDSPIPVTVSDPNGATQTVELKPDPALPHGGVLTATVPVTAPGLYRVKSGSKEVLAMAGVTNTPEFGAMRATENKIAAAANASGGSVSWLEDHPTGPEIRRTDAHAPQQGWGWIGLKKNGQYHVTGSKAYPLLPVTALLIVLLALALWMWWREGRSL